MCNVRGWGTGVVLPLLGSSSLTFEEWNQPFWRFLPRAYNTHNKDHPSESFPSEITYAGAGYTQTCSSPNHQPQEFLWRTRISCPGVTFSCSAIVALQAVVTCAISEKNEKIQNRIVLYFLPSEHTFVLDRVCKLTWFFTRSTSFSRLKKELETNIKPIYNSDL